VLFSIEAATVFTNDLLDAESDCRNDHWGPFNGGSRVLQDGVLADGSLRLGAAAALAVAAAVAVFLAATAAEPFVLGVFILASATLALSYTMPPLRLSYRTFGEIDVAITHSFLAILAGFLIQNGALAEPVPWVIGAPLFVSILPSIILSGVPDHDADKAVGKRTVAVLFGIRGALMLSAVLALLAAAAMLAVEFFVLPGTYGNIVPLLVTIHAVAVVVECTKQRRRPPAARRIDATMVVALTFILWFCLVPLWTLAASG
jgi:1,4-dihydroxy-2-naphthoate octaprenyltransferase